MSKTYSRLFKFFSSIRIRFLVTYLLIISAVLIVLNTYPLVVSRDLIFNSKQTSLMAQSSLLSTSLEGLESLTEEGVTQIAELLETGDLDYMAVRSADGDIIYTLSADEQVFTPDEDRVTNCLSKALTGSDVFYSSYSSGVFTSYAASPIVVKDHLSGTIVLAEADYEQGSIIRSLQNNIFRISIGVFILTRVVGAFVSLTLTNRITKVLNAIKFVREGEYSYRVSVTGNDELTELSEEFNSLTGRLQVTEEMRRRFVSDASHELKTPLASIRLLSDSILQNADAMDAETVKEFVTDIGSEADRLTRTTEKLLNLTRHDSNLNIPRSKVDIKNVVGSTMRILAPLARRAGVNLNYKCDNGCTVLATEDDIYQVVLNLAENAIKYNLPGGRVDLNLKKERGSVVLTVKDTGIGIPDDDLPNIFDRFYRVDKARSREAGGSGLGLSIVKSTVEEHGGTVEALKNEGGGMCFKVTLPYYSGVMVPE
ncbi:MAG: HAMP domain-containing histidine kinase, partial [Oscillospiraceae bacterium]|nr:HAMP domain-containing histidine kinase [Oscillospiraceae bacterium]